MKASHALRWQIWREQDGCCAACGDPFPTLETHHITPVISGGTDARSNRVALCGWCHGLAPYGPDAFEAFCGSLGWLGAGLQAVRRVLDEHVAGGGSLEQVGLDPTLHRALVHSVKQELERMTHRLHGSHTRVGMAEAKRQGKWTGRVGYGYRIGKHGELVKEPDEQRVLARARELVKRLTYKEAAQELGWSINTLYFRVGRRSRVAGGRKPLKRAKSAGGKTPLK